MGLVKTIQEKNLRKILEERLDFGKRRLYTVSARSTGTGSQRETHNLNYVGSNPALAIIGLDARRVESRAFQPRLSEFKSHLGHFRVCKTKSRVVGFSIQFTEFESRADHFSLRGSMEDRLIWGQDYRGSSPLGETLLGD